MNLDSAHVDNAIARALRGESHLDPEVLKIAGFSTPTMRHLFNNLCHLDGATYLEVGVFKGASFIAAFNNSPIAAFGVDDFSQDFSQGDIRTQLCSNLDRWSPTGAFVKFIEGDCFKLASNAVESGWGDRIQFDIFCYDGHHDAEPTSRALPAFFELLANTFIYIVDDFHWKSVSTGVQKGFDALADRVTVKQQWALSGNRAQDDEIFHNGLAIFLCEKIK